MANKPAHPNLSLRDKFARLSGRECREAIKHISSPNTGQEKNEVQPKTDKWFRFSLRFSSFGTV